MHISRLSVCLLALLVCLNVAAAQRAVFDNDELIRASDQAIGGVRAADMTGDGIADLVVLASNYFPAKLQVYPGNGDGTFGAARETEVPTSSEFAFDIADLNDDGKLDVAVAFDIYGSVGFRIFRGVGDGSFTQTAAFNPPGCWSVTLRLADMTSDGRPDVVSCGVAVFPNLGSGNFGNPIRTLGANVYAPLEVLDANGDGLRDVLQYGRLGIALLTGNGDGTFDAPVAIAGAAGESVAAADFDGNGRTDFAFLDSTKHDVAVLLAAPDGTYAGRVSAGFATEERQVALEAADMDGDGRPDLIAGTAGRVTIWLTKPDGTPGPPMHFANALGVTSVDVADLDGDGAMDAVTGGAESVAVQRGEGAGRLRAARVDLMSREDELGNLRREDFVGAGLCDVTGDGKLDAITVHEERRTIRVLPGHGDGTMAAPVETALELPPERSWPARSASFADFDGDGLVDLALTGDTWIDCWLANEDGTFSRSSRASLPSELGETRSGDFDGDGRQDLLEVRGATIRHFRGNGDGTFAAPVATTADGLEDFVSGDVNGDGAEDIVAEGAVFLGSASRTFARVQDPSGADMRPAGLADLNGDGNLDFVQSGLLGYDPFVFIRLGAGDGTFAAPRRLFVFAGGTAVAGDFNADGDVDLLFNTTVFLGDGQGSIRGHASLRRRGEFLIAAGGDVDGNGSTDLLLADRETGTVEVVRTWLTDSREAPVTITIAETAATVVAGQVFDLWVTASHGTFVPSGRVLIGSGDEVIAVAPTNGLVRLMHDTPGAKTLTARFVGDDFYGASAATPISQEATRAVARISTPATSPSAPRVRDVVRVTGTITSNLTPEPTGTVTALIDGVVRGTGTAPSFDIEIGTLPLGYRTLEVQYAGDALHLPAESSLQFIVEQRDPEMTLSASPAGSPKLGTPVTVTASFPDAAIEGQVSFRSGHILLASLPITNGKASFTLTTLRLGENAIQVTFSGNADYVESTKTIVIKVVETATSPASLWLITPCRLLDTRDPASPWGAPALGGGKTRAVQVTGRCGIPEGASAVALNVTAVAPSGTGFLALFPLRYLGTSTVSYRAGKTRASSAVIPLFTGGILQVLNGGSDTMHFVLDVTGYFQAREP